MTPACGSCGTELAPDAAFCDECGTPVADGTPPGGTDAPNAVRKTVTVLFCDLAGSTAFGERVDAESSRELLGRYHAMVQQVIDDHDGTVAKFIGDGVMAVFGIPEVGVDDAERAVAAGLDLQRGFVAISALARRRHDAELGLRVGLDTGEIVIADGDADLVGDVLNTAARLEAACEPGQVLVGEDTWRFTRATVAYESLGVMPAKGKREGVATFRAVDEADPIEEPSTPFVGRAEELARLQTVFDDAVRSTEARLVTVIGSPGVGKTRLAAEFERRLGDDARAVGVRLERTGGTTFSPVADLLEILIGATGSEPRPDDAPDTPDALRALVEGLDDADRVAELLAGFLGRGSTRSTEEMFFAVRRLLEALGRDRPLALVVDDVQWAEPLFLDLLENLAEWSRGAPVVLVALARPEIRELRPAFAEVGRRVADSIHLEGLDAEATADLAARLVGTKSLSRDLIARLPDSTEGNPLFVRELMRMLIDDEVLVETELGWELTIDAEAVDVPPTIQSLLSSRIERLPDDERRVTELASVVGPEFPLGAVAAIGAGTDPGRLLPVLERLRRKELVEPTGTYWGDEPVFRFHHALIRDAAYRRLLKRTRAELHLRAAAWIDDTAPGVAGEHEVATGYHLEQAHHLRTQLDLRDDDTVEIGRRAAALFGVAARRALDRDDVAGAAALFVRAVDRLDPAAAELPELLLLGCDALLAAGDVAAAAPLVQRLAAVAGDDARLAAWVASFEAQLLVLTEPDELVEAERRAATAADELAALGDRAGEANARLVRAGALARLGHIGDCEHELDLALTAARTADDARRVATVLGAAPVAALWGPSPVSRAGGRCLDVIRLLRITIGSPSVEATATRCQAVLEALRGRFGTARTMLAEARRTVEELGHRRGLLETQLYAGIVELLAGDPVAAEPYLRDAYGGLGRLGIGADAGQAAAHLSRALLLQDRLDEAAELALDSDALAGQNPQTAIAATTARAEILAAQGAVDEAVGLAEQAVARAEGTDILIDHANANLALARVRRAAGDRHGARAASAAAEQLLREKGASGVGVQPGTDDAAAADDDLADALGALDEEPTSDEVEPPWNAADAEARRLLAVMAARDMDTYRDLLAEDVVVDDRRAHVRLRAEGVDAVIAMRRPRVFAPESELVAVGETLACRGDDLVLRASTFREAHRTDGPTIEFLAVTSWNAGSLSSVTLLDPDQLHEALSELDRLHVERIDDVATHWEFRASNECLGTFSEGDTTGGMAFLDDACTWQDHRPLGFGLLDRPGVERRFESLGEVSGTPLVYPAVVGDRAGPIAWVEPCVTLTSPDGAKQRDDQIFVNRFDPSSGLMVECHHLGRDQRGEARRTFDELVASSQARGDLWNAAAGTAGMVNTWVRRGDGGRSGSWIADVFTVVDVDGSSQVLDAGDLTDPPIARRHGFGASQRRVLAVRGERLALSELRNDDGDGTPFHLFAVEEIDAEARLCRVAHFDADALADALAHLGQRWLEVDRPEHSGVLAMMADFDVAMVAADSARLDELLADDLTLVDHRPLAMGAIDKTTMLQMVDAHRGETSPMIAGQVLDASDAGVIRSLRIHAADPGDPDGGTPALSVVGISDGRLSTIELFRHDEPAAARDRFAALVPERADHRGAWV